jgi:hypothetical protein
LTVHPTLGTLSLMSDAPPADAPPFDRPRPDRPPPGPLPDVPAPEKPFYSLVEVADICGRPLGLVRRWVFRRQLDAIWMDDETPVVPLLALRARLRHPHRVERSLRGRRPFPGEDA